MTIDPYLAEPMSMARNAAIERISPYLEWDGTAGAACQQTQEKMVRELAAKLVDEVLEALADQGISLITTEWFDEVAAG